MARNRDLTVPIPKYNIYYICFYAFASVVMPPTNFEESNNVDLNKFFVLLETIPFIFLANVGRCD